MNSLNSASQRPAKRKLKRKKSTKPDTLKASKQQRTQKTQRLGKPKKPKPEELEVLIPASVALPLDVLGEPEFDITYARFSLIFHPLINKVREIRRQAHETEDSFFGRKYVHSLQFLRRELNSLKNSPEMSRVNDLSASLAFKPQFDLQSFAAYRALFASYEFELSSTRIEINLRGKSGHSWLKPLFSALIKPVKKVACVLASHFGFSDLSKIFDSDTRALPPPRHKEVDEDK